jgi:hypothetical protein
MVTTLAATPRRPRTDQEARPMTTMMLVVAWLVALRLITLAVGNDLRRR